MRSNIRYVTASAVFYHKGHNCSCLGQGWSWIPGLIVIFLFYQFLVFLYESRIQIFTKIMPLLFNGEAENNNKAPA